jgi:predicted RNase H-like HicB family nuclease
MFRYLVVYEKTNTGFSAYVPDLPGCIITAADRDEAERSIYEAIKFHLEGLQQEKETIPAGNAESEVLVFT